MTNEQRDLSTFNSVNFSLVSFFQRTEHINGTIAKRVDESLVQRTKKCGKGCVTCPQICETPIATSHATGVRYGTVSNFTHNCETKGVIYLIECRKCKLQYVGLTSQSLKARLSGHKSSIKNKKQTLIAIHFATEGHTYADLSIRILEQVGTCDKELRDAEHFWIQALNTAYPLGMNEKIRGCNGLTQAKIYDGLTGTPYLKIKGIRRKRPRGKRSKTISHQAPSDIINRMIPYYDMGNISKILQLLKRYEQNTLRMLRNHLCTVERTQLTQTIAAYVSGIISIKPELKKRDPLITIVAQYVNHGMDKVLSENIFNNRQLRKIIPDLKDIGVRITYKREPPISRTICNHTSLLKKLTPEKIVSVLTDNCYCSDSPYLYAKHGHIITGDLEIVADDTLRKIMKYGAKYRIPAEIDYKAVRTECNNIITQFTRKYKGVFPHKIQDFCSKANEILDNRIDYHSSNIRRTKRMPNYERKIRKLQKEYVITPADKAANNLVVMCPKFYIADMCKEMGVTLDIDNNIEYKGNDVYVPTNETVATLIHKHGRMATNFGTTIGEENETVPLINATPKLHKDPYKMRYIAGARLSTMKNMSIIAHKILKCLHKVFKNYCSKITHHSDRSLNSFWSINNSSQAIRMLDKASESSDIQVHDFSTLFTALSHKDIKDNLIWLIHKLFSGTAKGQKIEVNYQKAYFTKNPKGFSFDLPNTIALMEAIIDNAYVSFGGVIFRQTKGVPMGGNCSPMMADLTLTVMEHKYVIQTGYANQMRLQHISRYIDDILCVGCPNFAEIALQIYPKELVLKRADNTLSLTAPFLDLDISRENIRSIQVYDKTKDFGFTVVKFINITTNAPPNTLYQIYQSRIISITRIITKTEVWQSAITHLNRSCIKAGAVKWKLGTKLKRFMQNHDNLLWRYGIYTDIHRQNEWEQIMNKT